MKNRTMKTVLTLGLAAIIGFATTNASAGEKTSTPLLQNVALRYDVQEPKKIGLKYDVYAGGFQALSADLDMDLTKKAYDIGLDAKTEGFIGSLFPWSASYSTSGHSEKGVLIPTISTSRSAWKDSVKMTEMSYSPKGELLKTTTQTGNKTTVDRDVNKQLSADAVDILTGTLLVMQNAKNTDRCEGTFPVFDGKRRFNITLKDDGHELLPKSKYSKFSGDALRCTLKVDPVAGFNAKDQKRGWMAVQNHTEARHKLPTIWLARVEEKGPVIPVRVEIASEYGAVVAHLSGTKKL